jgi:hypothetical protein
LGAIADLARSLVDQPSGRNRPRRKAPVIRVVEKHLAPWTSSGDVHLGEQAQDLIYSFDCLRTIHHPTLMRCVSIPCSKA